jgi:hypothetical protein
MPNKSLKGVIMKSHPLLCHALLATMLVGAASCTALYKRPPNSTVHATGEPLRVETRVVTHIEKYKEKVGRVETSRGEKIGDIYEVGTRARREYLWQPYQGDTHIDAEAFFRITGDTDAAAAVRRSRKRSTWMYRAGIATALLGVAVIGLTPKEGSEGSEPTTPVWAMLTGGSLVIGGGVSWYFGWKGLDPDRHGVPSDLARDEANYYNRRLGAQSKRVPTLGVRGGF